jgi:hypothetical protein
MFLRMGSSCEMLGYGDANTETDTEAAEDFSAYMNRNICSSNRDLSRVVTG